MTVDQQVELLSRATTSVLPVGGLKEKLSTGRDLVIKLGMDPTAPDLHLGHAVVLSKMRQFQDLGHTIILIIGDFTARIGDPTGRSKTRPPLTTEQIVENTKTYIDQVSRILDPKKMTVRFNSEWLDALSIDQFVKLCGKVTLARIIERDDFCNRLQSNQPIGFHELLYPLFQGYDSVALKSDVELGGSDQTFNLLCGRYLQEQYGQEPQIIMTTPLLEGLDGVQKMSKSYGNYIGLTESDDQAFGKLMSISDTLMWRYYEVLLYLSPQEIAKMQDDVVAGRAHPMNLKKDMAQQVVARFWSPEQAQQAREQFERIFQSQDYSQATPVTMPEQQPIWIVDLLKYMGAISSSSEARRLLESGAVSVDGEVISDFKGQIACQSDMIIKVGKHRIYKLQR